jgi:transcriptional regulator with XRE-family HTH domain
MAKLPPKKLHKRRQTDVGHYVKEWRKKRGFTQEYLAGRVDKSRGLISQIEIGETDLTEPMIYGLAAAFGCKPGDLFNVNPLKEGIVVDITDELRGQPAEVQAEALGYIRGLVRKN